MVALPGGFDSLITSVGVFVMVVALVVSPFAPAIARRLGKDHVRIARGFAVIDGGILLWRAIVLAMLYLATAQAPAEVATGLFDKSVWMWAWAEFLFCLIVFVPTLAMAVGAHRTSAST